MADIKVLIGQKIKAARLAKGLTQQELSEVLGISRSVVANYERGKQNLTIETLQKIAKVLQTDFTIDTE